jgi:chromosome segregation ATPase
MRRATSAWWIAGSALFALVVFRPAVAGQTSSSNQDTLAALLIEVRGLRAAMEQMASAGPRVQLAFGRLQLQEQRIGALLRRADGLHEAVSSVQNEVTELQKEIARYTLVRNEEPANRPHLEAQLAILKQQLARKNADIQRFQAEEGDTTTQITAEQARWVEINQRLEELERSLVRR